MLLGGPYSHPYGNRLWVNVHGHRPTCEEGAYFYIIVENQLCFIIKVDNNSLKKVYTVLTQVMHIFLEYK